MNLLRRNIEIAFSLAEAEHVLSGIKGSRHLFRKKDEDVLSSVTISREYYYSLSRAMGKDFSYEEILHMYEEMMSCTHAYRSLPQSIFQLLIKFSDSVLKVENGRPVCYQDKALKWRSVSLIQGQDLFTCSYLAYLTVIDQLPCQVVFDWPAVIETDDKRLRRILDKGIAENHFHLVGSTRVFTLSWVALMNNPEKINHFFNCLYADKEAFEENRKGKVSFRNDGELMSWSEMLLYAAWIRSRLFQVIYNDALFDLEEGFYDYESRFEKSSSLISEIRALQYQYSRLFRLPSGARTGLDYALCESGSPVNEGSPDRLMCGERELMYRLFLRAFRGQMNEIEQDLFYAYLLLKNRFRAEIIQVNQEVGFANFSMYQDRKDTFWEGIPEYWYEAQRLAVNSTFRSGTVRSLEMRFQPKTTFQANSSLILDEDQINLFNDDDYRFLQQDDCDEFFLANSWTLYPLLDAQRVKKCADLPFFYVMHFIKKKIETPKIPMPFGLVQPRNSKVRYDARIRALALADTLYRSNYLCTRIKGIDAASYEIGCRPETFATEFRFLAKYVPDKSSIGFSDVTDIIMPKIGVTYHAGEDFLDITDGLRAIDEAILFLHLKRGDRIGHALALGIEPWEHYRRKHYYVTACKQDMLDNYIWILKRGQELGVSFEYSLESGIRNKAEKLLDDIYGECIKANGWKVSLDDYYDSWKLRGDNPLCYSSMKYFHPYEEKMQFLPGNTISYKYYKSYKDSDEYDVYRSKENICGLVYYYHYGYDERKKGMETCSTKITNDYISLVRDLQDKMRRLISQEGIMIECNPSSNQLIGTFSRYDNHPLFRLNSYGLGSASDKYNISVSLNTDDQGVFDTSLENEYALIADSMAKMKDEHNERRYTDDVIYEYLDHIRDMGITQTFN